MTCERCGVAAGVVDVGIVVVCERCGEELRAVLKGEVCERS